MSKILWHFILYRVQSFLSPRIDLNVSQLSSCDTTATDKVSLTINVSFAGSEYLHQIWKALVKSIMFFVFCFVQSFVRHFLNLTKKGMAKWNVLKLEMSSGHLD